MLEEDPYGKFDLLQELGERASKRNSLRQTVSSGFVFLCMKVQVQSLCSQYSSGEFFS